MFGIYAPAAAGALLLAVPGNRVPTASLAGGATDALSPAASRAFVRSPAGSPSTMNPGPAR